LAASCSALQGLARGTDEQFHTSQQQLQVHGCLLWLLLAMEQQVASWMVEITGVI
jgi:hypothetical protein